MNVIFMLPSGSKDVQRFTRTAALLRDAAHRTVIVNPQHHRRDEIYGNQNYLVAASGFSEKFPKVVQDYKAHGTVIIEVKAETPEAIAKMVDGMAPKEVQVVEGLPTARPITNTPSGTLEGLPPIVGDDAGGGEGLIIRSEGRRSK